MSLANRTALVVGGSEGIGYAAATLMHQQGADVVLMARRENVIQQAVTQLKSDSPGTGQVLGIPGDVTRQDDITRVIADSAAATGRPPQIVVNSAGVGNLYRLLDLPQQAWEEIFDVHAKGPFLVIQAVAQALIERNLPGSFINITSLNGVTPTAGLAHYCAAKAAAESFTKVAAIELAPYNIRVNAVAPGIVETAMTTAYLNDAMRNGYLEHTPLGRLGAPDDIAQVIAYLAGDESRWVTGTTVPVDGGAHMMGLHSYADALGLPMRPASKTSSV